jgi:diguanylate cyclase (GGDEF)-like protein
VDNQLRLSARFLWLVAGVYCSVTIFVGLQLWQKWGGALTTRTVDHIAALAGVLFAAGCAGLAARSSRGRGRRGWLAMMAGLLAWTVADAIWGYYEVVLGLPRAPSPSWADAIYLIYPLAAGVGVTLLSAGTGGRARLQLLLDGVIVGGSLFLVLWVGVIDRVFRQGGISHLALAVSLAYPVAGVVIITIAFESAVVAYRPSFGLLVAGLVIMVMSGCAFTALNAVNRYSVGSLVDLGWLAGCGLLGLAALRAVGEAPAERTPGVLTSNARNWLPFGTLVVASAVGLVKILPAIKSVPLDGVLVLLVVALLIRKFISTTENHRLLSDVGRLAYSDQLTGLANRALFHERLGQAVTRQAHEPLTVTVLCLDLDGFNAVNDELGHPAGDELLIQVAQRISGSVRSADTVARLGGDEFAILLEGDVEDTVEIAHRILKAFEVPIIVDSVPLIVRPSVGMTVATADMRRSSVSSLIRQADLAMYAAKRDGGACLRSFVPELPNPYELPARLSVAVAPPPVASPDVPAGDGSTVQPPKALPDRPRWPPRGAWVALYALGAGVAVFALWTTLRLSPTPVLLIDYGLNSTLLLSAAALVAARALRDRAERGPWLFIAAGMAATGLGTVAYAIWVAPRQGPSFADPLFASFYPLVFTGLVLLIRRRLPYVPGAVRLDSVVVGLTFAAVAAALLMGHVQPAKNTSSGTLPIAQLYPAGGLLALGVAAGSLAILGLRNERRWVLLVAGVVLYAVANTVFVFSTLHGTYVKGTWIDALWPAAFLLIAAAAWAPRRPAGMRPVTGRAPLLLPMVCTVVSVAVTLLADHQRVPVTLAALSLVTIAARLLLTFRDASALAQNHHQAMTDELTGLANRLAVATTLTVGTDDIGSAEDRRGTTLGLVLLALDEFEEIAGSLGAEASDELRYRIATRLSSVVDGANVLARVAVNEFAVLMPQGDLLTARTQAGALMDALSAPFTLDEIDVQVEVSIGIALWPSHCRQPQELLTCAEAAMKRARTVASHIAVCNTVADVLTNNDGYFIADLRSTLASDGRDESCCAPEDSDGVVSVGELVCHYQPKIRATDDSVHSAEALVRWRHPTRGLLLPDQFLPAAEHAGLMQPITARVLDIALAQIRAWRDGGISLTVAVNLSSTNLLDIGLVETIDGLLHKHGLPAESLILEITESTLMTDSQRARSTVSALRRLGARLSLDDYGTGWSSLARLQDLSVDELKLDRVFVARLSLDPRSIAIVRSTVALAHSLSADLVAEGVEDEATLYALRQYGCNITQGNVHSPPLPPEEFERWIQDRTLALAQADPNALR